MHPQEFGVSLHTDKRHHPEHHGSKIVEACRRRVTTEFVQLGMVELTQHPEGKKALERFVLLDTRSDFVEDELHCIALAHTVIDYVNTHAPQRAFTPTEQRAVERGTWFSDISKTGPVDATPAQQRLIVEIYHCSSIDTTQTVSQLMKKQFPNPTDCVKQFRAMNIGDPDTMTMEQFFNLHSQWTYDILDQLPLDQETVRAASMHHKLKGDFVRELRDAPFDRAAQLVQLLDLYDAFTERSGKSHAEAIAIIEQKFVAPHADKPYYSELCDLLDSMKSALQESIPQRKK